MGIHGPDQATISELIDLFSPLMGTPQERKALLSQAFTDKSLLDAIDYDGATLTFVPLLIEKLVGYGEVTPGKLSIETLLDCIYPKVGVDKQARIERLCQHIEQAPPYPNRRGKPTTPTIAAPNGNPFYFGGPIKSSDRFVGRESELCDVFTRLQKMGCTSVVGERRIGKSSLLYQIQRSYRTKLPGDMFTVYIDLLDVACHTAERFLAYAMTHILDHVHFANSDNAKYLSALDEHSRRKRSLALLDFSETLQLLQSDERIHTRPILLIDEFEAFIAHPETFDDRFFDAMRSLIDRDALTMVTASCTPLEELIHKSANLTSKFPNEFVGCNLGPFSEAEAFELLTLPSDRPFAQNEQRWLIDLSGGHPAKLQNAAIILYEAKADEVVDYGAVERAYHKAISPMLASAQPASGCSTIHKIPRLGQWARRTGNAIDEIENWIVGAAIIVIVFVAVVVGVFLILLRALGLLGL